MKIPHALRRNLLALTLFASASPALAELPRDVQIERLDPTRIAVVWTGAAVSGEQYRVTVSDRDDAPTTNSAVSVTGAAGRVELDHAPGVRPYVRVDDGEGRQALIGERVLPLEGGINFRDLGGYPTSDGRQVRWGALFRSGAMDTLTDGDYAYLQGLGIKTICDLRASQERSAAPTQKERIAPGADYVSWDYDLDFDSSALKQAFATGGDPKEAAIRMMSSFYRTMPREFAPRYRAVFDALKAGEGLLFNCSAGKDRTGLLAALVLTTLGVVPDAVAADYAMSQRVASLQKLRQRTADPTGEKAEDPNAAFFAKLPPGAVDALMGTDPVYLFSAFDQIRADYGSIDAYIERELGVSAADRFALQARYLEPAPGAR
ncbi:tyrosine-protein phosphatase [Pseudoxanthomonas putridarboris]|uniref:Tyrosine-protein phosphatase n=1 Tax=Pseudoxanthomonas putridarboris TaxID=752605 RepID=A0ABU9J1I0_9GAMM